MSKQPEYLVDDPAQLRELGSPVRQALVDAAASIGPCSISELAEQLGRPSDGLYYHVRALLEVGLLVEAGTRATTRRDETLYDTPTRGILRLAYRPGDPENVTAITRIVGGMLRDAERDFASGFTQQLAVTSGPQRTLTASRQRGWLTRDQRAEVNGLLLRLQQIFDEARPGEGTSLQSLTLVLAPIEARAARRGE
ncbi:MAG: winged helix-turn-helix domain-containing protein [Phycisphaerales bacterium JB040]